MRHLLLFIFFLPCYSLIAQVEFEFSSYEQDEKRRIFVGHENQEGHYIIPITVSKLDEVFIHFVKIDESGEILLSTTFKYDSSFLLINQFFFVDNEIIVLGTFGDEINQPNQKFWIGRFDSDFTFLGEQFFDPLGEPKAILLEAFLENDSTIVFGGVTSSVPIGNTDFGGKLFLSSDTSYVNFIDSLTTTFVNDVIARKDSSGYILYGSSVRFTDSLFQLTRDELSTEIQITPPGTILSQNDSTLLLTGEGWSFSMGEFLSGMVIGAFDYAINLKKYHQVLPSSEDTLIRLAVKQGIEINDDGYIYAGGTYNIDSGFDFFESSNNSAFLLVKYDAELNPLWQKYYGLDSHYYMMSGLIATTDGGCLMYGYRFTADERWEAVAIKVNENGVMTNTSILMKQNRVETYPNPFQNIITLNNKTEKAKKIIILDEIGRVLLIQFLSRHQQEINLSFLANGVYFYVIENEEGIVEQNGKLIKVE